MIAVHDPDGAASGEQGLQIGGPPYRLAATDGVRMIIVGSHGESPRKGAIIGYTPYELAQLSDVPVVRL
jgi:hypothetical protein